MKFSLLLFSNHSTYFSRNNLEHNIFGDSLVDAMTGAAPLFIPRIGGSDCETVLHNVRSPDWIAEDFSKYVGGAAGTIREYVGVMNGYFDADNSLENYLSYLNRILSGYSEGVYLTACTTYLLNQLNELRRKENEGTLLKISPCDYSRDDWMAYGMAASILDSVGYWRRNVIVCDFHFIESLVPFLFFFDKFAADKTFLLVTPFAQSIEYQLSRSQELIPGHDYSQCTFTIYETPITYSYTYDDISTIVSTKNWGEQTDLMCEEIRRLDFDIALLSCGSYAMPIGTFIKNEMGKKALYMGGPLQKMFNIGGARYEYLVSNGKMPKENYLATPLEAERYKLLIDKIEKRVAPAESVRAYF